MEAGKTSDPVTDNPFVETIVRTLAGKEVATFQLQGAETVRRIKVAIEKTTNVPIFAQQLVHKALGILEDKTFVRSLLPSPAEVQFVHISFDAALSRRLLGTAARGNAAAVERLLQRRAHPDFERAEDGVTPLAAAAHGGHAQVVRILCEHGVDTNKCTQAGWAPLHFASQGGHAEVVRVLCAHGADKDRVLRGAGSPIHLAACAGHLEVVKRLCEAGADKDNLLGAGGRSPLHVAATSGHMEVVQFLVESGVDQHKPAANGVTPSFEALRNGHREVALFLGVRPRGFTL